MAKTASLKTIALRALKDPKTGAATRLVALRAAKPYLDTADYEQRLRQLADTARGKVLRLLLVELTEIDAASRARSVQHEAAKRRADVDAILAEAARELGLPPDPATAIAKPIQEDPNPTATVVTEQVLEPPVSLSLPVDGPSSAPVPATSELEEQRAQVMKRGRELAAVILAQLERNYRAPYNREEGLKLDNLQAAFVTWEKQTRIQFPDINTQEAFPDSRLRPPPTRIVDERSYRIQRRTLTIDEQLAIPAQLAQAQPTHKDSGMWGGIPPGI